ncbi:hypothetical protein [Chitinivorax sp. B]|uniref:hypothetical protein n=1 Tax=Chitinivorax sp. B TaxID=2502235 RepID=UPI0010F54165|nr:hypothetical protein [Chitinivorax sp. B]
MSRCRYPELTEYHSLLQAYLHHTCWRLDWQCDDSVRLNAEILLRPATDDQPDTLELTLEAFDSNDWQNRQAWRLELDIDPAQPDEVRCVLEEDDQFLWLDELPDDHPLFPAWQRMWPALCADCQHYLMSLQQAAQAVRQAGRFTQVLQINTDESARVALHVTDPRLPSGHRDIALTQLSRHLTWQPGVALHSAHVLALADHTEPHTRHIAFVPVDGVVVPVNDNPCSYHLGHVVTDTCWPLVEDWLAAVEQSQRMGPALLADYQQRMPWTERGYIALYDALQSRISHRVGQRHVSAMNGWINLSMPDEEYRRRRGAGLPLTSYQVCIRRSGLLAVVKRVEPSRVEMLPDSEADWSELITLLQQVAEYANVDLHLVGGSVPRPEDCPPELPAVALDTLFKELSPKAYRKKLVRSQALDMFRIAEPDPPLASVRDFDELAGMLFWAHYADLALPAVSWQKDDEQATANSLLAELAHLADDWSISLDTSMLLTRVVHLEHSYDIFVTLLAEIEAATGARFVWLSDGDDTLTVLLVPPKRLAAVEAALVETGRVIDWWTTD